jgi:hypothetical protein
MFNYFNLNEAMHKANILQPQANIQGNVDLINIKSVANLLIL